MKSAFVLACTLASLAHGQIFTLAPVAPASPGAWAAPGPRPTHGSLLAVDAGALTAQLAQAPMERREALLSTYGLAISLPSPSGALVPCFVAESPVMEAPLQALHQEFRTYIVQTADRSASGRLELSPRGLTAMLRTSTDDADHTAWMIDPWQSADPFHVVSYWLRDLPGSEDWTCSTVADDQHHTAIKADKPNAQAGGTRDLQVLRTVRLAMACTGEWGAHQSDVQGHAPNGADPLAAIVTLVGRANVIYEADIGVHFNLVANNNLIVYFDPATDPYPDSCDGTGGADCSGPYLAANISNLASVIGNSNFDIGHILTRVFGGVAYLGAVCHNNIKAGGASGIPRGGDIDPFTALVAIHEMGHQFGANHTFNGTRGRCAGNVNLSTAWEAGSGSSPMAYAGGCPVGDAPPTDNVVQFADPFFHHGSLLEMQSYIATINCPVQTTTINHTPTITLVTPDSPIPPGTPFVLSAAATDSDNESLTYSWEEYDSGFARPLSGSDAFDNGMGALFRVFPPVASGSRTFPRMADVLSGVPTPGEMLPTVTGVTRKFRVIVRDNHPGAGGTAISALVNLSLPSNATPFTVMSPSAGSFLIGGSNTVTWTVGGTTAAPISCTQVAIKPSTDDGATFPTTLGVFPNTGSAAVSLPQLNARCRIKVEGNNRIFFSVSPSFVLHSGCAGDFNHDGSLNSQDFFAFLTAFFAVSPAADFNLDGQVNSQDFFDYLGAFFAGC